MKILAGKNNNLTELEVFGLSAQYNLADGHSYVSAKTHYSSVLCGLPGLWDSAAETPVQQMETAFKEIFAEYFTLDGLKHHEYCSICPTASNSIDIIGAWARSKSLKIGLVEPTFDNLALLLRRREVTLEAVPETALADLTLLKELIQLKNLDALFLVNPNNPTGVVIDSVMMTDIIDICCRLNVVLIIDASFRFCHQVQFDEYALLKEKDASFIILEDTGKQWPTLDAKASLLSYSQDLADDIRQIYEEVYLCCSNFTLRLIIAFVDETLKKGGISYIRTIIDENTEIARAALAGTLVSIESLQSDAAMSVMWLNIERTGLTDLELTEYLAGYGVAVLPGRYFYWNSHHVAGHYRIRIALMKPDDQFRLSIMRLKQALVELEGSSVIKEKYLVEAL
ncbi:aminotransferase class I/II-fold pyridoxal phosphate-dependent enzyme [Pseudomonas sp. NFX98]|uniref:aminotransferase class I/II-fold pyridoxal phosphate-dependent enzyme n=1 Tax=Pseudomonas sp. NFX98 TaxID=3399122 RepID=UPI0039FC1364